MSDEKRLDEQRPDEMPEVPQEVEETLPSGEPLPSETPPAPPALPTKEEVQAILNEMVWKHGGNLEKRPDFVDLLKAGGLQKSDVSKSMLKAAERETRKRGKALAQKKWTEEENKKLIWMPEPDVETLSSGKKMYVWESKCGRYRVYLFRESPTECQYAAEFRTKEATWDIFEHTADGPGYPKYVNSLEVALIAVEKFHEKETGTVVLVSNRQEVLDEEVKLFPKLTPATTSVPTPAGTHVGLGRGSKNPAMDERILAVLDYERTLSPKQIKEAAGIELHIGINSIMKRLGKEEKVIVAYGAYKLHPSYKPAGQQTPAPTPAPTPTPAPAAEEKQEPEEKKED